MRDRLSRGRLVTLGIVAALLLGLIVVHGWPIHGQTALHASSRAHPTDPAPRQRPDATSALPLPLPSGLGGWGNEQDGAEAAGGLAATAWFTRQRAYPLSAVPAGALQRALAGTRRLRLDRRAAGVGGTWQQVGLNGQAAGDSYGDETGRVTALVVSPASANTLFAGTADGGVWKSVDRGASWTTTTDGQDSLAIGAMAIAPTSPYTVYALTGEGNFSQDNYYGAGLLQSIDGGRHWRLTGTSLSGLSGNRLVVDPSNPTILYAALTNGGVARSDRGQGATSVSGGIFRSTDGGATWAPVLVFKPDDNTWCPGTSVFSGTKTFGVNNGESGTDIVVTRDGGATIVYAALGNMWLCPYNGIYRSADHGTTWVRVRGFDAAVPAPDRGRLGRIALAMMPSNPRIIYAAAAYVGNADRTRANTLEGIYESTDGGQTWLARARPDDLASNDERANHYYYDLYIAVDPTVPSTVFLGGIDVFKSTDSGRSWSNITNGFANIVDHYIQGNVHPDQHALVFLPASTAAGKPVSAAAGKLASTIYIGNDGGIYRSDDGGVTWQNSDAGNSDHGIEARQIYHSAISAPGQPIHVYSGLQDNGVGHYTGTGSWRGVPVGDGTNAAVAGSNSRIAYIASQEDYIEKTTDGGQHFTVIASARLARTNPGSDTPRLPFITPLALDPTNPDHLLAGTYRLWETTDGGDDWHTLGAGGDLTRGNSTSFIDTVAIAPTLTSVIYAGTNDGLIQWSADGGRTFARGLGLPGRAIGGIAVSPTTARTAWAGIEGFNAATPGAAGHVFQTTDGGRTWRNVSGAASGRGGISLPDVPVNGLVVGRDGRVYVATDTGVFVSTNATGPAATWAYVGNGLPNAAIFDLNLRGDSTLYASTHGRGLWRLTVTR